MPGYLIARVDVSDPNQYGKYTAVTPDVIARHGGRFIVRGGPVTTLEGPEERARVVVIEFPSREAAVAFYHSPDYREIKKLREGAAVGRFIAVEGVE
jgi:uncharacterized protein (DUF1330 family)